MLTTLTLAAIIVSSLIATPASANHNMVIGNARLTASVTKPSSCNIIQSDYQNIELGYHGYEGGTGILAVETNGDQNSTVTFTATSIRTSINGQRFDDAVNWNIETINGSLFKNNNFYKLALATPVEVTPEKNTGIATLQIKPRVNNNIKFKTAESIAVITVDCNQ